MPCFGVHEIVFLLFLDRDLSIYFIIINVFPDYLSKDILSFTEF